MTLLRGMSLTVMACTQVKKLASDLTALGNWKTRADVLKGLEPVVRKVQEPDGYASYREYEDAVRVVIDRTQRSIASEMEAGRLAHATGLTQMACDLNQMLEATAICKAVRKGSGKDDWSAQRMMVLSTNKWTGGSDVSTTSFAEKAKEMNIFYKLYSDNSGVADSDDPFGRGGAFDRPSGYRLQGRPDRRRCYLCNQVGHIAQFCPNKGRGDGGKGGGRSSDRGGRGPRCFRCGQVGHVAADCTNDLVPRDQQNRGS